MPVKEEYEVHRAVNHCSGTSLLFLSGLLTPSKQTPAKQRKNQATTALCHIIYNSLFTTRAVLHGRLADSAVKQTTNTKLLYSSINVQLEWKTALRLPAGAVRFDHLWAHPATNPVSTWGSFPRITGGRGGLKLSIPPTADDMNAWSYASTIL